MQSNDKDKLREFYCDSWQKFVDNKPLTELEQQIVTVVKEHPEYHQLIENKDASVSADYLPEMGGTNPFLHLGMHLGIREQVVTDRPAGIAELYQRLVALKGVSDAEHDMMECLGEMILIATKAQTQPDEISYLNCLGKLVEIKPDK